MNAEIFKSKSVTVLLSDEQGLALPGKVFLVIDGELYGRTEILPWGGTAAKFVRAFLTDNTVDESIADGAWGRRSYEAITLAERFVETKVRRAEIFDD